MVKRILIIFGILLILGGLGLFVYNLWDGHRAQVEAEEILDNLKKKKQEISELSDEESKNISSIKIDNYDYIGTIIIPKIKLELPVIDSCSENKLKKAPCLFDGSINQNNAIIAGHAYISLFGKLKNLQIGDSIFFEDILGNVSEYTVSSKETLSENDVDKMYGGEWDLTLFTCNLSGDKRITIRSTRLD